MASSSPTPARSEGLGGGLPAHAAPGSCSLTALVGGLPRGGVPAARWCWHTAARGPRLRPPGAPGARTGLAAASATVCLNRGGRGPARRRARPVTPH